MKCEKCDVIIVSGDERDHHNQTLCEDCYLDSLSTIKTCDPWASRSAKNCDKLVGDASQFTSIQSEILNVLKIDGPIKPEMLLKKLSSDIPYKEMERDFAILHHMGKVGAKKQGKDVLWCLT